MNLALKLNDSARGRLGLVWKSGRVESPFSVALALGRKSHGREEGC
jgi:hypothetical protein